MIETDRYLSCMEIIDCDSASIREKARELTEGLVTDREKAIALFYFTRDEVRHNPYAPGQIAENYKASATLARGNGHCQHKAVVLVALCRAAGIPARPGYVDIRDHLLSPKFRKMIGGGNLLIVHGYAEIYIDGRWVHVSPAYDTDTCSKGGFIPVEFDGIADARDSQYDTSGNPHIEHVKDHGPYEDMPLEFILKYTQDWVARGGMEWDEFRANVKRHYR